MQINLKAHNAIDLTFSTKIILTSELLAEIHKLSPPDSDGDSPFLESYQKHRAWVWVPKPDEKTLQADIIFTYEAKGGGKLGKKRARISQLVELLSSISKQFTFDCRALFQFSKKLHAKSIVSLPQKSLALPDMPFDIIQGMHLVKLKGSETKYDVFLEVPTQGVIIENIVFEYSSKIDNMLANNILAEAIEISDKFIFKE